MRKYSTNKSANNSNNTQKKSNIFKRNRRFKAEEKKLKSIISKLEKKLKKAEQAPVPYYSEANIAIIKEELYDRMSQLKESEESHSLLKRKIAIIAAALGITLTIASASIASYANGRANEKFDNNIESAYSMIQEETESSRSSTTTDDYTDLLYDQLKADVSRYVELNKQETLDNVEKKELDNVKSRIKANPKGVTKLSLDILKQKIANSIGIDDFTRIRIEDASTSVVADQNNPATGKITDISILLDGNCITSVKSFQSLASGERSPKTNSVPEEVLECIAKVVKAQNNEQDFNDSNKALKSALSLDEKDIKFSSDVIENIENDKQLDGR